MKQANHTIVLTGGGSGGHTTPLLSLARELKGQNPDCRVVYIGYKGDDTERLKRTGRDFDFMCFIKAGKFRRYHGDNILVHLLDFKTVGLNIRDMARLPGSVIAALRILRQFKPAVVFSKGGFVSVPVGVAARIKRIPIVTHDSDTIPGLANRIVGRWAVVHATGMPAKYYQYPRASIRYVGIPVDKRVKKVTPKTQAELKNNLGIPKGSPALILSGGGNGSKRLNELMVAISRHLLQSYPNLYIVHASGRRHESDVKQAYAQALPKGEINRVKVFGFSPDFYSLTGAADLVITRGGATTLAELAISAKACIIIPSPFLTGGHQLKNAQELADKDAAIVVDENVAPDELLVIVSELLNDKSRRERLADNLNKTAHPNAAGELAGIILQIAKIKD